MDNNARNWLKCNSLTKKQDDIFLYLDEILCNYTLVRQGKVIPVQALRVARG
jgi:hypothetical protein